MMTMTIDARRETKALISSSRCGSSSESACSHVIIHYFCSLSASIFAEVVVAATKKATGTCTGTGKPPTVDGFGAEPATIMKVAVVGGLPSELPHHRPLLGFKTTTTTTTPFPSHRSTNKNKFLTTPPPRIFSKKTTIAKVLPLFLRVLLILAMVVDLATAFLPSSQQQVGTRSFLVPSQVVRRQQKKTSSTSSSQSKSAAASLTEKSKQRTTSVSPTHLFLVPSQVVRGGGGRRLLLKAHHSSPSGGGSGAESSSSPSSSSSSSASSPRLAVADDDDDDAFVPGVGGGGGGKSHPNQKRQRRRKKKTSSAGGIQTTTSTPNSSHQSNSSKSRRKPHQPTKSGNLPDVFWRSIPLEHLRHHPNFEALPLPETIQKLESLEDIRLFRQESWQWDAVHEGRCTTSQAVAALGFLEPETGMILGVPQSWRHGGRGAYHRLRKPALRTLEEMNEILCRDNNPTTSSSTNIISEDAGAASAGTTSKDPRMWKRPDQVDSKSNFPFAAKYMLRMTQDDVEERRKLSKSVSKRPGFEFSVRMMWGNAQEATALLTALNYFWEQDSGIILKEVGMCGGGLKTNHTTGEASSLLVGATPDGLLCYPNGTIEALEVKNHCPFFPLQSFSQRGSSEHANQGKRFFIRHFDIQNAGVPPQYIPQLMMEMFCIGENCRSSIMVRQTATSGSLVLRVRRDDSWIEEMLYWLNRFQKDFVEREEPPPPNFFLEGSSDTDRERYIKFLEKTKELQGKVEVVTYIPHGQVQRAMAIRPGMANLFLD